MKKLKKILGITLSSAVLMAGFMFNGIKHNSMYIITNKPPIFCTVHAAGKDDSQIKVFVSKTGKKYHFKYCRKGEYDTITLKEAKERGLKPCKKCA